MWTATGACYTIASYTKTNFDKTSNDLRDKRLLTFDSDKLTRLELAGQGPGRGVRQERPERLAILKPRTLRADGSQVEELIRKLKDAKMDTAVSDAEAKKAAAEFASGAKVATVTVSDPGGNQELDVRRDKDKTYYAKSSVVDGVYKIPADLGDGLDKKLDDFRNKKLFDFGWSDPGKVDIRVPAGTVSYSKSGEKWMRGTQQMDSASVQAVIDKLRDLSAAKFVDSAGTGEFQFEATVTSNDGKRVEKVAINKSGNQFYAKREGEPSIYELDTKAVGDLLTSAGQVKEFQQQPPKKK